MATKTIKTLLVILFTGLSAVVHAQYDRNENKIWVFGVQSGIDFNGPTPVTFNSNVGTATGATVASQEGSATISNENGRFLFHTNGTAVWDSTATMMPHGENILGFTTTSGGTVYVKNGTYSTSQGAAIVPVPDSAGQYFIFSLTDWTHSDIGGKLFCNKVRMDLNSGRGDVDTTFPQRHLVIDSLLTERMTVVAGSCFKWLLVYTRDTNSFKAYRITNDGLDLSPVVSHVGNFPKISPTVYRYRQGLLKASPDGTLLVNALFKPNNSAGVGLELYDFDYETGIVSNARILDSLVGYVGADFSPDNSKLYATSNVSNNAANQIYQFDLSDPNRDSIRNSKFPMGTCASLGDVRLAPDGKLYFAKKLGGNAGIYSAGNLVLCSIEDPNQKGTLANYKDSAIILTTGTGIMIGLPNIVILEDRSESLTKLKMDTVVCPGFSPITVGATYHSSDYLWSIGLTDSAVNIAQEGAHFVSYKDHFSCSRTDTFKIEQRDFPQYRVALDTLVCPRFSLTLTSPDSSERHAWSTGTSDSLISITIEGVYYVSYADPSACSRVDTFKIAQQDFPQWGITVDKNVLGVTRSFESYQWFKDSVAIDGAKGSTYIVSDNGLYGVAVGYGVCTDTLFYHVNNVSVSDLSASGLRVYPNPASDVVYIDTEAPVEIKLYDMGGREVFTATDVRRINIGGLSQGTYFLQVYDASSGKYHRQLLTRSE